jgi:hypothetical protein
MYGKTWGKHAENMGNICEIVKLYAWGMVVYGFPTIRDSLE